MGLAVATLAGSCGGAGDQLTADNIADRYATTYCAAQARCCQLQGVTTSPADQQGCEQAQRANIYLGRALSASNTAFNADVAAECLKAAQAYACRHYKNDVRNLCMLVFSGHVPVGGSCTLDSDCQQAAGAHALCDSNTCVAAPLFGREGAPCLPRLTQRFGCAFYEGFICTADTASPATGTCTKQSGPGQPCASGSFSCQLGSYCDGQARTCQPEKKAGESCDPAVGGCQWSASCTNGVCAASNGTCVTL